jgi:hypothetical protein
MTRRHDAKLPSTDQDDTRDPAFLQACEQLAMLLNNTLSGEHRSIVAYVVHALARGDSAFVPIARDLYVRGQHRQRSFGCAGGVSSEARKNPRR